MFVIISCSVRHDYCRHGHISTLCTYTDKHWMPPRSTQLSVTYRVCDCSGLKCAARASHRAIHIVGSLDLMMKSSASKRLLNGDAAGPQSFKRLAGILFTSEILEHLFLVSCFEIVTLNSVSYSCRKQGVSTVPRYSV